MSLLAILLPPAAAGHYTYATSSDGQRPGRAGRATLDLLPPAGRGVDVAAVVPARMLSWHRVLLPRGIGARSPRLHTVLAGLLEDRLLQDPAQLHFSLGPETTADGQHWVAVCARPWLAEHLAALAQSGRQVARIVPALWPQDGVGQIQAVGQPDDGWLLVSGDAVADGVLALPLTPQVLALLPRDAAPACRAEPAVAETAEQLLGAPVALMASGQRLLEASLSPWNLAQDRFARTGAAGMAKRLGRGWRALLHAPQWQPLRWGLALLLLVQLVGLNLWGYRARADLAARRAQINAALTLSFPKVQVVVDAPVQMEREVAILRRRTGALTTSDLEPMLDALAQAGDTSIPTSLEFTPGELRLEGMTLPAQTLSDWQSELRQHGYALQADGATLVLRPEATP